MNDIFRNRLAKGSAVALISCALGLAPAITPVAFAEPDTQTAEADLAQGAFDNATYVAGLAGLTESERAELVSLLDRQDTYWNGMDNNAGLTDAEVARYDEIINISWRARLTHNLSADELAELDALQAKCDALKADEDLTETEWNRLFELQDKGYGWSDEEVAGDYDEPQTNAEYVRTFFGLTDAERAELCAILDKQDAYWAVYDATTGLSDADWTRAAELEQKAYRAETAANLTAAEYAELETLWAKLDALKENEDLTEADWDRMSALESKGHGWDEIDPVLC